MLVCFSIQLSGSGVALQCSLMYFSSADSIRLFDDRIFLSYLVYLSLGELSFSALSERVFFLIIQFVGICAYKHAVACLVFACFFRAYVYGYKRVWRAFRKEGVGLVLIEADGLAAK